jgi:pimeloyl-ACP methyl ester carboxylesterase
MADRKIGRSSEAGTARIRNTACVPARRSSYSSQRGGSRCRRVVAGLCSLLALFVLPAPPQAGALVQSGPVCRAVSVPASLDILLPVVVSGVLCDPATGPSATIQVLLHGATYNSTYWDFPYQPEKYSYVHAANDAGYSTLNIDRVGYGRSSHVLSVLLTGTAQALVVHQLIGRLRAGLIGGNRYPRVVLVGHSVGSGIAIIEAATFHDVQGVILTGLAHPSSVSGLLAAFTRFTYPALLDPKFAADAPDPGYLTTVPGTREAFFYSDTDVDPQVVAVDEATKDRVSITELADVLTLAFTAPISRLIDVPTLLVDGSQDSLFCTGLLASDCSSSAALRADEAPFFSSQAQLRAYVQVGAGHDVALSLDSGDGFHAMLTWADAFVGR